jgi:thiol:disulfide interchange protein
VPDFWPALVFGGLLILIAMAWSAWLIGPGAIPASDPDFIALRRQSRRRLQVNGLLAMAGVLIILVDAWPAVRQRPLLFVVMVGVILFLCAWMSLLALADMYSTRRHHRVTAARLRAQQRQLEQELEEIRAQAQRPYPPPEWN